MSSQRAFPRFAVDAEVEIRDPDGRTIARGRARNLSRGGLCAELAAPLPRGARVEAYVALVFAADQVSEPLGVPARVVWCTTLGELHQTGLAFLPLGKDLAHYLDMFIRFLEGGRDGDGPAPDDPAEAPPARVTSRKPRFDG